MSYQIQSLATSAGPTTRKARRAAVVSDRIVLLEDWDWNEEGYQGGNLILTGDKVGTGERV